MVLVRISLDNLKNNPSMPVELRNAGFNETAWSHLRTEMELADNDACCYACAVEWCVCLLLGFPCIFCCHPMVQQGFKTDKVKNKCIMINNAYFNGNPVVVIESGEYIVVNLDYVQGHIQVAEPSYNPVAGGGGRGIPIATAAYIDTDKIEQVKPAQQEVNTMKVVIPEGCSAGSVLIVAAPNGTQVQVVVPEGVFGGNEITIEY